MSLLRRLFGAPPSAPATALPTADARTTFAGRIRTVQIVGESFYEDALEKLAGPKTENGVNFRCAAELVPDNGNTHDANAVMVRLLGRHVGHLEREHAKRFREIMAALGLNGHALTGIQGRIHGGWKRPDDEGNYSVTLLLPASLAKELGAG